MDAFEFMLKLAEAQGVAALFGILMLVQNYIYTKRIIAKNCEMEKFLMDIIKEHFTKQVEVMEQVAYYSDTKKKTEAPKQDDKEYERRLKQLQDYKGEK